MIATVMQNNKIDAAIVGADRIARNGDFANKIGTYSLAVNCKYHHVPLYVAAPYTTIDPKAGSAQDIPIEERDGAEVIGTKGLPTAKVFNPAFDITPAKLTSGWILDRGFFERPNFI
jgi:methylthioribose-1-phosphate isomerase